MTHTRREFVRTTAGGIASLLIRPIASGAEEPIRIRKDVAKLDASSREIKALTDAVRKMRNVNGGNDKRSWVAQAAIHGTAANGFTGCQHGNWFFLPWHRMYLYFFEEIVRKLSGENGFALPYWDWSRQDRLPSLFWGPDNVLDNPVRPGEAYSGRRKGLGPSSAFSPDDVSGFVGQTVISRILSTADFETFAGAAVDNPGDDGAQGQLEATPHNFVHRWVGGDMVTGGSPLDPIFWLHHCNIDRLWTEWMVKHSNGTPADPKWLGAAFNNFIDGAGQPGGRTVGDVLDTRRLHYVYEHRTEGVAASASVRSIAPVAVIGASQPAMTFESGAAVFKLQAKEIASPVNALMRNSVDSRNLTVRLKLRGVQIPEDQDVSMQVYINCRRLTPNIPITDPGYVSSCTFFGHGGRGGGHGHGSSDGRVSFLIGANRAFANLYADRPLTPDEPLNVALITRPLFKEGRTSPAAVQELRPEEVRFEVVRSVGG